MLFARLNRRARKAVFWLLGFAILIIVTVGYLFIARWLFSEKWNAVTSDLLNSGASKQEVRERLKVFGQVSERVSHNGEISFRVRSGIAMGFDRPEPVHLIGYYIFEPNVEASVLLSETAVIGVP
jgi:hypothetical protein